MYNETTLMVNVDSTSKKLSDTAVNMWIANEVVLELDQPDAPDVESGKSFYAQMTKKVLSVGAQGVTDGYYFTFDTGDVFFSATANGYPELVGDTLNIGTGNGGPSSGDAPLLVEVLEGPVGPILASFAPNTKSSPQQHHLSKTAAEIWDANVVVMMLDRVVDTEETGNIYYSDLWDKEIHAGQKSATRADGYYFMFESGDEFYAATAADYPVLGGELKIGTITPGSGSGGGVLVVHEVTDTLLNGVLPNIEGYEFTQGTIGGDSSRFSFSFDIGELSLADLVVSISGQKVETGINYENGKLEVALRNATPESSITGLSITVTGKSRLDHTYAEIAAAGFAVLHKVDDGTGVFSLGFFGFTEESGGYIGFLDGGTYIAETENDYPVLQGSGDGGGGGLGA